MSMEMSDSLLEHFAILPDPRKGPAILHRFIDIMVIAICAVICGADDWIEIEAYGRAKQEWLQSFLELPHGIPSHDTFGRVFAQLDAEQFSRCFASWTQSVAEMMPGQVIALDGKTVRRSHDRRRGKKAIHMVSAWADGNHLVLGQVQVDSKSNEITAIPELLHQLDIHDCIVTIDAMGCQREIASQIIDQKGDYILAVKENQPHLAERVPTLFKHAETHAGRYMERSEHVTTEKGHGRIEERRCLALTTDDWSFYLDPKERWEGLRSIIRIEATREIDGQSSTSVRYYISSLAGEAAQAASAIRAHWGVENNLHWMLDVDFREDASRLRVGHAAHNFSILRRLALELLRRESTKVGVKAKRLKAGWDDTYLLKVLTS